MFTDFYSTICIQLYSVILHITTNGIVENYTYTCSEIIYNLLKHHVIHILDCRKVKFRQTTNSKQ